MKLPESLQGDREAEGLIMKLGFIGLGRMGGGMVERLLRAGHAVVAYDSNPDAVRAAEEKGAVAAQSIKSLVSNLEPSRYVWIMLPAGTATAAVIGALHDQMARGDVIIDGSNSNYNDTIQRAATLKQKGIFLLDAGISGGIRGFRDGYCAMVGGDKKIYKTAGPIFNALASENGYALMGVSGSGHFVKMVHNGIEYALLQSYGEGFEILKAKKGFKFDLHAIADLWSRGSVIRSWILDLCCAAFDKDPGLSSVKGYVEDSGEGRWAVIEAINQNVPAPTITLSLLQRFVSRQDESFSAKLVSALRNEFGGHPMKMKDGHQER
jgi:6-phosphogluconate dehydrogenase